MAQSTPPNSTPKKPYYKGGKDQVKNIVSNLYKFLFKLKLELQEETDVFSKGNKYSNLLDLCASICEVSQATVKRVISPPKISKTGDSENLPPKTRLIECDSFTVSVIRRTVMEFYARKEHPTIKKVLRECKKDDQFPRVEYTTFRKWMKEKCFFKYRKFGKKPVFLERSDIVCQRELYLRSAKNLRAEGFYFIYTDETWANPDIAPARGWQLFVPKHEQKNFAIYTKNKVLQDFHGNTGGFMVKGGAGRVIINHAGGSQGFIPEAEDIFISQKDSKDYHRSMNSEHWLIWFKKLVDAAPEKSVIVLDRATYHMKKVASTIMPRFYWNKPLIVDNLVRRNIPLPDNISSFNLLTKRSLIELSSQYPVEAKYLVDVIVEESGKNIRILWLPVAHCELNPIELVWSAVKREIAKQNKIGGTKNVYNLSVSVIQSITPELWRNCVDHAIKVEKQMWERDQFTEELLTISDNRLVNYLNDCDSDSDDNDNDNELDGHISETENFSDSDDVMSE